MMDDLYSVLIADDEKIDRDAYKMMIARNLPQLKVVGEAEDGISAVRFCCTHKPDIVLMDISMPGLNGLEAIRVLRRERVNTSIIIISAYDYFEHAREALTLGVFGFLVKPVSPAEMKSELNRAVAAIAQERQRLMDNILSRSAAGPAEEESQTCAELTRTLLSGDAHMLQLQSRLSAVMPACGTAVFVHSRGRGEAQAFFQNALHLHRDRLAAALNCENSFHILLLRDVSPQSDTPAFLKALRFQARAQHSLDLCFAAGQPYESASGIISSLTQAALVFDPKADIAVFDAARTHVLRNYPYEREVRLIDSLQKRETDRCRLAIRDILADTRGVCGRESFFMTRFLLCKLFLSLNRMQSEMDAEHGGGAFQPEEEQRRFDSLHDLDTLAHYFELRVERMLESRCGHAQSDSTRIVPILAYIRSNYNRDIPLSLLARRFYFSQGYMGRLLKETTGLSYTDLIFSLRMERAKELLRESQNSISSIAQEVGYSDANYFTKAFKRATGLTPQKYRKQPPDTFPG